MALSESQKQHLNDIYNKCLSCGLCLPTCPTYNLDLREESSPRGRIRLIHSAQNDKLDFSKFFVDEMYFCLDCHSDKESRPALEVISKEWTKKCD
ncbi:MAG: 4Fe-4S dicluster domain-containing protein [Ignavibacteriales bacterium]|nr:4Fe-4S dicluster domain-containing protein [Ignavibacteriales bacterium]